MSKISLTFEEKAQLIEAINNDCEPDPDLLLKFFPSTAEKVDLQALDRARIPTLEYAGKRSKAAILAEASAGIGAAPLQVVRKFGNTDTDQWRNLIVQGDNLQFLKTCYRNIDPQIKDKVKGQVKLIYIDPPFATKSDFGGKDGERSYSDKIATAEFIESLRERLIYLRELLADDGSIYVHLDWKMTHYVKIIIDETFGEIVSMSARYVTVLTVEGKEHLIPNEDLITHKVINWSHTDRLIRIDVSVGVSYKANIPLALKCLFDAVQEIPRVNKSNRPMALLSKFNDSSIDLTVNFWITDPEVGIENIQSQVRIEIWKRFKTNNIEIPFPQRDVHIKAYPSSNSET